MTDNHSTTPPPELFKQWEDDILNERENVDVVLDCAWKNGYRAGADQELEACCEWLIANDNPRWAVALQEGRRPKPPSLAEEALEAIDEEQADITLVNYKVIRAALERLQELENQ